MSKYPVCNCKLFLSGYNPKCPVHGENTTYDKVCEAERKAFWDEMTRKVKDNLAALKSDSGNNEKLTSNE